MKNLGMIGENCTSLPSLLERSEVGIVTSRLSFLPLVLTLVVCAWNPIIAHAQPLMAMRATPPEQLQEVALAHEKNKRYEEALQTWLRVYALDRSNAEAKLAITRNVRLALQTHRHRDPQFQARILAMSQGDVLALYAEVLDKIQSHYVDPDKANIQRLFRQGMEELLAALSDPQFTKQHVKSADEVLLGQFRANLKKAWAEREVTTTKQALEFVAEIGSASKRLLGLRTINPIVCEFICGACNSLDEYSAYLSAGQFLAEGTEIVRSTVEPELRDDGVLFLRIAQFLPSTPQEIETAIKAAQEMGPAKALVFDLRGNSGGTFLAAVKAAEKFLPAGIIVTANGQHNEFNKVYTSTTGNLALDLPIVVLVNGETASAAEVFAVALRDNQRAKLVGTGTFGKGTVQNVIKFTTAEEVDPVTGKTKPRAAVRITLARLLAPSGNPITGVGVTPDTIERDAERQTQIAHEQARELARRYGGMRMMEIPR